ncbi:MAG: hypothetical protein K1W10_05400 [Lachnospiraceae bacterium]
MGYKTCPHCGAHLDPDERCDCQDLETAAQKEESKKADRKEKQYHE